MQLGLHDPRFVGLLLLVGAAVVAVLAPGFAMEVLLTIAASAVLAPGVAGLSKKIGITPGLIVASIAFVVIAAFGLASWYGVPVLVRGINETLTSLPSGLKKLTPAAEQWLGSWKGSLEALFPGHGSLDEIVRKKLPELAGPGKEAARVALATIFGSVVALGHALLFLVLTAILTAEWDKNTAKARHLVELYAPRQAPTLLSFGAKFQNYGGELFVGIGIVMLIFMPIFFLMLYFFAKLSLGKSVLYGIVLGITSAIPTVGGIITYLLVVVVGVLNLGIDADALWKIGIMYAFSFVVHFAETKFVTPRVLGHRIDFTSFAVISVLVGSVLVFGIGKGILAGLFLLVALKAITEVSDEAKAAGGMRVPRGEPPPIAPPTGAGSAAASMAGTAEQATPPAPPTGERQRFTPQARPKRRR